MQWDEFFLNAWHYRWCFPFDQIAVQDWRNKHVESMQPTSGIGGKWHKLLPTTNYLPLNWRTRTFHHLFQQHIPSYISCTYLPMYLTYLLDNFHSPKTNVECFSKVIQHLARDFRYNSKSPMQLRNSLRKTVQTPGLGVCTGKAHGEMFDIFSHDFLIYPKTTHTTNLSHKSQAFCQEHDHTAHDSSMTIVETSGEFYIWHTLLIWIVPKPFTFTYESSLAIVRKQEDCCLFSISCKCYRLPREKRHIKWTKPYQNFNVWNLSLFQDLNHFSLFELQGVLCIVSRNNTS